MHQLTSALQKPHYFLRFHSADLKSLMKMQRCPKSLKLHLASTEAGRWKISEGMREKRHARAEVREYIEALCNPQKESSKSFKSWREFERQRNPAAGIKRLNPRARWGWVLLCGPPHYHPWLRLKRRQEGKCEDGEHWEPRVIMAALHVCFIGSETLTGCTDVLIGISSFYTAAALIKNFHCFE